MELPRRLPKLNRALNQFPLTPFVPGPAGDCAGRMAEAMGIQLLQKNRIKYFKYTTMGSRIKKLLMPVALSASVGLLPATRTTAQTFTNLHSFAAVSTNTPHVNAEGANPFAGVILAGNMLYGTAQNGGNAGTGAVFGLNTDGTGFTNLHNFSAAASTNATNSDGTFPFGGLIFAGGTLYGTTESGGTGAAGTVFAIGTNSLNFTNLHFFPLETSANFTNSDGASPFDSLILSSNMLYGTANSGGMFGGGSVFGISTNGAIFTNLHNFATAVRPAPTNSGGAFPIPPLILSGNTLFGTAELGGMAGNGTIFRVNTDGTGFTNLHDFTTLPISSATNGDGAHPVGGLVLSGNTMYGTTQAGGTSGKGVVFAINTDGNGFTNLHSFTGTSDGAAPESTLMLSSNTLYGTALSGGSSSNGTVFAINTDGTGFTNLHSFTTLVGTPGTPGTNSDGANPAGTLLLSGSLLYGTTQTGGASGSGTVFRISLGSAVVNPPQLMITAAGTNVILKWPANPGGFTLQSNANPGAAGVWGTVSPQPTVIAGTNTVTNAVSTTKMFYRLTQ